MGTKTWKGRDICERTRRFAVDIINFCQGLSRSEIGRIISRQLIRSGTAIGAHVEEGQAAESARDFLHKMKIGLKEARETRYWLSLLKETYPQYLDSLIKLEKEADEIVRILFTIIQKTKLRTFKK